MKEKSKMLSSLKRLICASLALVLALSLFSPITAEAKDYSLKYQDFSLTYKTVNNKAKKVSTGTSNITIKKKNGWARGYVKFTAPKSKTYSFTASNLKDSKGGYANGHISAYYPYKTRTNTYLTGKSFKIKKVSDSSIWISSKKKARPTNKETGTIKLKKGETVYLHFSFLATAKGSNGKISHKLVIK